MNPATELKVIFEYRSIALFGYLCPPPPQSPEISKKNSPKLDLVEERVLFDDDQGYRTYFASYLRLFF